jgi:hypothetical protein
MFEGFRQPKKYLIQVIKPTELVKSVSFSLKHISFSILSDHVKKNAGIHLPTQYSAHSWYYLSNFYYNSSSSLKSNGSATRILQTHLKEISKQERGPIILCCEPILGTDPRSITWKNCEMTSDERYNDLCKYYQTKFHLQNELQIDCTLKTEITGHGQRWSNADRKFMWGLLV